MNREHKVAAFSLVACLAYWLLESFIHASLDEDLSLLDTFLLNVPQNEMRARLVTVAVILLLGLLVSAASSKRRKAEEKVRHLNLVLGAIRNVNQLITTEKDRDRLIKHVCKSLTENRGYHHAWIILLDKSGNRVAAAESEVGDEFQDMLSHIERDALPQCAERALKQTGIVLISSIRSECPNCPLMAAYAGESAFAIRLASAGKKYGVLCVSVPPELTSDEHERSLFVELANDLSLAISEIELEKDFRQAEQALQESEERIRLATKGAKVGLWDWNVQTGEVIFNDRWAEMIGYSPSELRSHIEQWEELAHPEDRTRVMDLVRRHFEGSSPFYNVEYRLRTKSGEYRYILGSGEVVERDADGKPVRMMGTNVDITERKQAEKSLSESEIRYRTVFEKTRAATMIVEADKTISMVNSRFEELSGFSKAEVEGEMTWDRFVVPEDLVRMQEYHRERRLQDGAAPTEYEFRFLDRWGNVKDMFILVDIIPNTKRSIVSLLDISELKQAQVSLRAQRDLATALNACTNLQDAMRLCLDTAVEVSGMDCGGIYLVDEDDGLTLAIHKNVKDEFVETVKRYGSDTSQSRIVLAGKPVYLQLHNLPGPEYELDLEDDMLSLAVLPITHEKQVVASLNLASYRFDDVPVESRPVLESIAAEVGGAIARMRAEESLQRRERQYRTLAENVGDVIWVGALDKRQALYASPSVERLLGYTPEEVMGMPREELLTPESMSRFREYITRDALEKAIQGDGHWSQTVDLEMRCKDGTTLWTETTFSLLRGEDGAPPEGLLAVSRDITERKLAENSLRRSEIRLAKLNACLLSFGADASENISRLTAVIGEVLNGSFALYNRIEEGVLQSVSQWHAPPDFKPTDLPEGHICCDVIEKAADRPLVIRNLPESMYAKTDPDVTRYGLQTYIGQVVKCCEKAVGSLCVVYLDDVEPTREDLEFLRIAASALGVEEERKRASEALRESEEKFRATFEQASVGMVKVLPDGKYLKVNQRFCEIVGYSMDELLKMSFKDITYSDDVEADSLGFERLMAGEIENYSTEKRYVRKDGAHVWVHLTAALIHDARGRPTHTVAVVENVTERKLAQDALLESEERYRSIVETAVDGFCLHDTQGRILDLNDSYCRMVGYTRDELLKMSIPDLDVIYNREEVAEKLKEILSGSGSSQFETVHRKRDGTLIDVEVSVRYLPTKGGRMVVFLRDITERKRAEDALKDSEQRYRSIVETAADGFCICDLEGRILDLNDSYCRMVGYTRDELLGMAMRDLDAPQEAEVIAERLKRITEQGSHRFEVPQKRKDGTLIDVEVSVRYLPTEGNQMVIFLRDVTERKRAEEALRESEERYRLLAENVSDVIWIRDLKELSVVYGSPSMKQLVGFTAEEAMRQSVSDAMTPESLKLAQQVLQEELQVEMTGDADPHRSRTLELEMFCKDGRTVWTESKMTFLRDENNKPIAILGVTRDISERRQTEEKLLQAEKMQAVGRLAGGIAHDFNNILTAIIGNLDMLRADLQDSEPVSDEIDEIHEAAIRASELTHQLLAFSRKQMISPKVIDLNDVVSGMEKMLRRLIPESIEIDISLEPHLPATMLDPTQVQQIILNLALNSRDAMPYGGRLVIETKAVKLGPEYCRPHPDVDPGSYVALVMTDTGVGMDAETLSHVFEPFYTTKELGRGTGLGLSTVYGIVKQSGGHIAVSSEKGRGTRFDVFFSAAEEVISEAKEVDESAPTSFAGVGETILLVEDEEPVRNLVERVLTRNGYDVRVASNAAEAIDACRDMRGGLDLLLTDVVMPDMGGQDLAEVVAGLCPGLATLFMSGYTEDTIANLGVQQGEIELIAKPFSSDDLLKKIRAILDRRA